MTDMYFLDVNVLMYAAGREHPLKQPCLCVLASIEAGIISVAIDAEIVQELLYRYTSIGLPAKGAELAEALLDYHPTVIPLGEAEIKQSLDLFNRLHSKGLRPRDALHAAAMLSHGIVRIISTDHDFDLVPGIIRLDPQSA